MGAQINTARALSGVSEPFSCVKAILCHLVRQEREGLGMAFIQMFVLQLEKIENIFPVVWCPARMQEWCLSPGPSAPWGAGSPRTPVLDPTCRQDVDMVPSRAARAPCSNPMACANWGALGNKHWGAGGCMGLHSCLQQTEPPACLHHGCPKEQLTGR